MSSTDHIYHRAAKRRGDKFDRSMTRGKLLGNNAPLFIFISILIMTQLISFLWKNSHGLLQLHVGREALAYCQCASALISWNKALFASVDLIGEKNQVILEFVFKVCRQSRKTFLLLCCLFFLVFFSFISFPLSAFCDFSAIFHWISLFYLASW